MKYVVYMCLLVWFATACHNKKKEYSEDHYGTHDREYVEEREDKTLYYGGQEVDSLGYYGVYEGSRWDGAETYKAKLVLFDNNRYRIEPVDLGNGVSTRAEEGTYLIFGDLLTLTPDDNGDVHYYHTKEDHLHRVDENQQVVEGQHATSFRMITK
ncbi:MAG: copper resistance protein NlpE N-terminal domain-containing protein [Tannerellaceae bacterium]|nr:copper resistance protein NlpE N-terminal domain-containing protein [Tannerellaceae bacterium]